MSPRTGRPKAENPKAIKYSIRLDADTEKRLQSYCEEHGITKGEAIRQGIHLLLEQKKIRQPGGRGKSPRLPYTPTQED